MSPRAYWLTKSIKRPNKGKQQPPTNWNSSTITKILSLQEYCGDILNFKTYSKSYKNKKRIDNDRENCVVFQDVHEPIIERAVYEQYEDEQKELSEKIKKLRSEIEKQSSRSMTTDMFIGLVRKYTRARKLTPRMLNELIEKIEVFNAEKIDGIWEQRLRIHYNCFETIEIPTVLPLPIPEVSVNTRKGVVVNYAPL